MGKTPSTSGFGWGKTASNKLSEAELTDCIQKKAKELWEQKGHIQGKDLDIWLEAERLVKSGKA